MKKIVIFHIILLCATAFTVWYKFFNGYIWYMEGITFFTFGRDFQALQYSMPSDWAEYAGAFLQQFFRYTAAGAAIQTLFACIILISAEITIWKLLQNRKLLWLAFIPVTVFMYFQFEKITLVDVEDATLEYAIWWITISIITAIIISILPITQKHQIRRRRRIPASGTLTYILPCLLLGLCFYFGAFNSKIRTVENNYRLDRLADMQNWDRLLKSISPSETLTSPIRLRLALLALSEKNLLAERLFAYGVTEPNCFIYKNHNELFCHIFNSQFFSALGFYNETIHHAFEAGMQSPRGVSFRSLRTITDACLYLGNKPLSEKYLEIMSHTCTYGKWVRSRERYLASENFKQEQPTGKEFFIGAHSFLSDIARIIDRYPDNRKAIDYLLCGLLISKDTEMFISVFNMHNIKEIYAGKLPRHYEEALLVAGTQHPELTQKYAISKDRLAQFVEFHNLLNSGINNRKLLEQKYRDSFWYYYYCVDKTVDTLANGVTSSAQKSLSRNL